MLIASHELDLARAAGDPRGRARRRAREPAPAAAAGSADAEAARDALARGLRSSRARTCGSRRRTRVTLQQILPFGLIVLLLFAFALDPDRGILRRVAPGLFWVDGAARRAARGVALVRRSRPTTARATACACRASTAARSSSARPRRSRWSCSRSRWCSASAWCVLYGIELTRWCPLVLATLAATVGLAATGTLYGVLAAGLRVRETLVPLLLLPVVAPVLLGATRAWEAAIDGVPSDAWPWVALLGGVRAALHGDRDAGLRAAPGGSMSRRDDDGC